MAGATTNRAISLARAMWATDQGCRSSNGLDDRPAAGQGVEQGRRDQGRGVPGLDDLDVVAFLWNPRRISQAL